ncbi:MAG: hypothetical protein WBO95_15945 [Candidatus Dechloromonas phosphoritropha]|jgi:hypothetical protein
MDITTMPTIARSQPMNIGSHFRAYSLRGGQTAEPIDPFLGVDRAWISAPTSLRIHMPASRRSRTCFSTRKPVSTTATRLATTT